MAKKIVFPLKNGDLQHWVWSSDYPTDNEIEEIYKTNTPLVKGNITWIPYQKLYLHLQYVDYSRGRSSVLFEYRDRITGNKYPMFLSNFDELLKNGINPVEIQGYFEPIKKGQNFAIKYIFD